MSGSLPEMHFAAASTVGGFGSDRFKYGATLKDPLPDYWFIQPKSDERPGVFYRGGDKQITDRTQIYGGCYGEVSVKVRSYCFPEKGEDGKPTGEILWGVSLVLVDVMKTSDGENLAKKSFRPKGEEQNDNQDIPF